MFDVGGGELLLIVLAILLLFGPQKLPEVAQTIGKGMRKIKQAQAQFQSQLNEIQNEINKDDEKPKVNSSENDVSSNESPHKIGAFDQLDLDKNFVTGKQEADETAQIEHTDTNNIEKVSTSKNQNSEQKTNS